MSKNTKAINYYNQACDSFDSGNLQKAIRLYEKSIKLDPDFYQALNGLGKLLLQIKQPSKALKNFERASQILPNHPIILANIGNAYRELKNFQKAKHYYALSLDKDPTYDLAKLNLIILFAINHFHDEAKKLLAKSNFDLLSSINMFFTICEKLRHSQSEQQYYLKVLTRLMFEYSKSSSHWVTNIINDFKNNDPLECQIGNLLEYLLSSQADQRAAELADKIIYELKTVGNCYQDYLFFSGRRSLDIGQLDDAIGFFEESLTIKKRLRTYIFLADSYYWLGDYVKAQSALKNARNYPAYKSSFADIVFAFEQSSFDRAWEMYLDLKSFKGARGSIKGISDINDIYASKLLVVAGQGIGDQVMFLSLMNDFLTYRKSSFVLHADPRLEGVVDRSFKNIEFNSDASCIDAPGFDKKIFLEDLSAILRPNINSFSRNQKYLNADKNLADKFLKKLSLLPKKINIGIAWKGGSITGPINLKNSKSASLYDFLPLLNRFKDNVNWINLQYGDVSGDISSLSNDHQVEINNFEEIDPLLEIESQLSLINCLDLVIQTSNASAHFSGSIGIPTWILVSHPKDWRWFQTGNKNLCHWYPSSKVFEKPTDLPWREHTASLIEPLERFINTLND